jgi:hypothetical protein
LKGGRAMMTRLLDTPEWSFWLLDAEVYRARPDSPVMPDGTIGGARWFCPQWQWEWRREQSIYPFDDSVVTPNGVK